MPAPTCIQNYILVELTKTFQDEVISDGGIKFYQDTSFRPEWNVTINGIVASVPMKITGGGDSIDPDRERISPIVKQGDEIIFNYTVVMNRSISDNVAEIFERDKPKDPYVTTWSNPKGQQIVRIYLNNDNYEVGLFDTKSKTWIDRIKGKEKDVENFMAKYMPTENHFFNYGNLLSYDNKDYWKVDYSSVIAIKRGGTFEMVGGYVLVEPIKEAKKVIDQGVIEVYEMKQSKDYKSIGKVISIGEPLKGDLNLSVKANDIIVIDSRYVEKYEIDGKDYWIVRQKYIYGKSITNEYRSDT